MNIKIGTAKTLLLLHMNGENGSPIFVDSSKNNLPITVNGNPQISTAQSKFGESSAYFDGDGSYLDISNLPSDYLSQDFTIEAWVWVDDSKINSCLFNTFPHNSFGVSLNREETGLTTIFIGNGDYWITSLESDTPLSFNTWQHIALVRSDNTITLYENGIARASTNYVPAGFGTSLRIGSITYEGGLNGEEYKGYMDEFRIIKSAKYISNFDVPTSPFSNDQSINITKNGSGKLIEKKYIDLFPPNFISKVTLSGGTFSNGTYTRNSGGVTTFSEPSGKTISFNGSYWLASDPAYNSGEDATFYSDNLIDWVEIDVVGAPTGVTQNALTFLFDPIFYKKEIQNERYKILVSGSNLSYVNGIYSQQLTLVNSKTWYIKDDDDAMQIFSQDGAWYIQDANERINGYFNLFIKNDARTQLYYRPDDLDWSSIDGGDTYGDDKALSSITQYLSSKYKTAGRSDPAFLEQIRNYQIDNTIPNKNANNDLNPLSPQRIIGTAFNTRKGEIKNNTFSYIKYSDNSDVEGKKLNRWYSTISVTQTSYGINPPKDSKYYLLKVKRNDNLPIFEIGDDKNSTLNMFIRLQRPVSHKNPHTGYIVREKRGIFCTSCDFAHNESPFSIGYRSPYYNITGRPSYRSIFDNFSFVFSFGHVVYDAEFGRPISRNLMTDYKFNFGQMYMLTIKSESNTLSIYINGELQTVAIVPFNPLVNPTTGSNNPKNQYKGRRDSMPLGPGFYKKNGTIYGPTNTVVPAGTNMQSINYLIFGKSALAHGMRAGKGQFTGTKKRRRYLNNLDIGVINSYNIALSQSDTSQIYNNFRYKYI